MNADSGEGYITVDGNEGDRKNLTLWQNADALISAVAAVNNNTIVVANSVGPAIVEPWIENPNITAVSIGHHALLEPSHPGFPIGPVGRIVRTRGW